MKSVSARWRSALLSGVAGLLFTTPMQAAAQDEAAEASGAEGALAGEVEEIIVLGGRLEESMPEDLETYGSRLEIVDGEVIDQAGFVDASQALQALVPGLYVAPQNGAFDYVNVSLLGSRTSEVLFLVDGVRISNRLYASTTPLDTLPAHMIERIEVLKGGQGLYYGTQAVGGIVNVVTRSFARETDGAIEAGVNTNDGYQINGYARGAVGDHYFVGYASHDQADGFQPFRDEDYQPSATDRRRSYEVTTIGAKYAFEPSDSFRLSASYQHTEGVLDDAAAEDVYLGWNERNEEIVSLKIDWSPADDLDIYVKGYWHDWDSTYLELHNVLGPDGQPAGDLTTIYDGEEWGFEDRGINILGEYRLTDIVALVGGYDFQKYDGVDDVFLIAPTTEDVHAPFAQVKLDLGAANIAAGIRHNMPSDGQNKTVWNVTGRFDINDRWFARGLVGTSFRLPSAYELYVVDPCCETGNPNLVGEQSYNTEIGIGYANGRFSAELMGFYRKVEDLIGIDYSLPAYPDGLLVNTDAATKVWGGELIVNARLSDIFDLTFDYTHTEAEEDGSNQQIQDIPRDLAKLILGARSRDGRFGATVALNYVGKIYDSVSGGIGRVEHGDYLVADLSGYAFLDDDQRHRIGLRLENLFDAEYASRISRVQRDSDGSSYPARNLGTPLTAHLTYRLSI